ncbi:glycoside hydrolase family 88 protein [Pelagicoccus sp. SDUM812003]|uniref:glycoside hydrolase family 88 protein n=1 Tax=Pelagicoccus sp. SDUM812003 TaxID=3041267 RepID=UPI00280EC824|nr:glycoside hydrolase family 88 protein [Pelagicoccus sp. SDUM812003]MDQ8201439.1 glycoside hydrolase family 88 protein [Pelagicoccus sp. SDUM812003]
MQHAFLLLFVLALAPSRLISAPFSQLDAYAYRTESIETVMKKVARHQLELYGGAVPTKDWLVGTFFSSFVAAYQETGDEWYIDQAREWGECSQWDIRNPVDADDVCPGQTYLDLYFVLGGEEKIESLNSKLSSYLGVKQLEPGAFREWIQEPIDFVGRELWHWCDALYMAPPVYARMGKATGDERYFQDLHRLYWDAVDFLYDPEEQLFFRDAAYFDQSTPNGKKVFWGRGNGWVLGGLARMLEFIPIDDPERERYLRLFVDLAFGVAKHQQPDGLWRSSLNDPAWHPEKETSGSAFYVYAMTKGINEGWLPRAYFEPVVLRGWSGLLGCVSPEGRLGYVQLVAGSPYATRAQDNRDYAAGAFILAGVEMLKLQPSRAMAALTAQRFQPRLVAEDGAWTWFNDERVIFHEDAFYASYRKSDGRTAVTSYGLESKPSCYARYEYELGSWTEKDNYNNASLLALGPDRILAGYTKHGTSSSFNTRLLSLQRWKEATLSGEAKALDIEARHESTYQNLMRLEGEGGRIYNFIQGESLNPYFACSDDNGQTWSEPVMLLKADEDSGQRPYVRYASNGAGRIDFFYTDGHLRRSPRNSIYHLYYEEGRFCTSTGVVLRTLETIRDKPIDLEEGTLVFDCGTPHGRGWVWDLEYDSAGQPWGAFISVPSGQVGTGLRYCDARFALEKGWQVEEIAYAGSNLYPAEEHCTGGITLDPQNENQVVISTNVSPDSGKALPQGIYQLFKGTRDSEGWKWEQLTHDPRCDQLRPVIVRGYPEALFWLAGDYRSYRDFDCSIQATIGY